MPRRDLYIKVVRMTSGGHHPACPNGQRTLKILHAPSNWASTAERTRKAEHLDLAATRRFSAGCANRRGQSILSPTPRFHQRQARAMSEKRARRRRRKSMACRAHGMAPLHAKPDGIDSTRIQGGSVVFVLRPRPPADRFP